MRPLDVARGRDAGQSARIVRSSGAASSRCAATAPARSTPRRRPSGRQHAPVGPRRRGRARRARRRVAGSAEDTEAGLPPAAWVARRRTPTRPRCRPAAGARRRRPTAAMRMSPRLTSSSSTRWAARVHAAPPTERDGCRRSGRGARRVRGALPSSAGGRRSRAVPSASATWRATTTATATSSPGRNPAPATSPAEASGRARTGVDGSGEPGRSGRDDVGERRAVGLADLDSHRRAEVGGDLVEDALEVVAVQATGPRRTARRSSSDVEVARRRRRRPRPAASRPGPGRLPIVAAVRRGRVEHAHSPSTSTCRCATGLRGRGATAEPRGLRGRARAGCRRRPAGCRACRGS